MPKPGDRVIIEGTKLGSGRREGELLEAVGTLLKIRWVDGSESLLTPGAGTIRFASSGKKGAGNTRSKGAKSVAAKPARSTKKPAKAAKSSAKKKAKK